MGHAALALREAARTPYGAAAGTGADVSAEADVPRFRGNAARGAEPDAWTAGARWEFEREIPDDIYFRATASQ